MMLLSKFWTAMSTCTWHHVHHLSCEKNPASQTLVAKGAFLLPFLVLTGLVLSGCENLAFEESKPRLEGERLAISSLNPGTPNNPATALTATSQSRIETLVALPPAVSNDGCPQNGCIASHAPGNLALNTPLRPTWTTNVGKGEYYDRQITASPIVAADKIFTLDSRLTAVATSAIDGKVLWRQHCAPANTPDGALGGGIAYDQGKIYIATPFAEVMCLDAATGAIAWRVAVRNPVRSAPTVQDGCVFVITIGNELDVLSAQDGSMLWGHTGLVEPAGLLTGGNSPAVVDNTVILAYSSGEVLAARTEHGYILWENTITQRFRADPMASLSHIVAHPVVDRGLVIITTYSGRSVALDFTTGQVVWEQKLSSIHPAAVSGDVVFILTTANDLVCLARATGQVLWSRPLNAIADHQDKEKALRAGLPVWLGPVIAGNRVIVASDKGDIKFLSPVDGTVDTTLSIGEPLSVLPVVAHETLLILSDKAKLHAFR